MHTHTNTYMRYVLFHSKYFALDVQDLAGCDVDIAKSNPPLESYLWCTLAFKHWALHVIIVRKPEYSEING